jgi:hypothetical protein
MKKYISLIVITFFLASCGHYKDLQLDKEMNINDLFKSWNKSTYKSIEFQAKSLFNSRKEEYGKELELFKVQEDIKSFDEVNTVSVRYKFLQKLSDQYLKISDYFIVETNISGEYYQPRIFVMYSRNKKSTDVMKFEYKKNEWEFVDSFLLPYKFNYNYKDYILRRDGDWNRHNVIVSHILNNSSERSDFFLKGAMKKFVFELPESANHF